jgi:hypothetical protein
LNEQQAIASACNHVRTPIQQRLPRG